PRGVRGRRAPDRPRSVGGRGEARAPVQALSGLGQAAPGRFIIHCEWGRGGLEALGPGSDVVIVVDVLSFSTCVEIAISRGAVVFPFAWTDARAAEFAREIGPELAGPRGRSHVSLSPVSFLDVAPGARIVLPSPNGATLSRDVGRALVLAGCLRNA